MKEYHVYVYSCGEKWTVLKTNNITKACAEYDSEIGGGGSPRLSVNGNELSIAEADALVNKTLRRKHASMKSKSPARMKAL